MNFRPLKIVIAILLVFSTGCSNKRADPLLDWQNQGFHQGPGSAGVQQVITRIRCLQGNGPRRVMSRLRISGGYHNGYTGRGPMLPGELGGQVNATYLGVSGGGDIMVLQQMSGGGAYVFLHLCEQKSLILPGRQAIQANIFGRFIGEPGSIVTKSRTDCIVNEVTAANLEIYLGPYSGPRGHLRGVAFPVRFLRFEALAPQLCGQRNQQRSQFGNPDPFVGY